MLKRLRSKIPFLKKEAVGLTLEEIMVAAREEAKQYPLILSNAHLQTVLANDFTADNGAKLPPREFVARIVSHIEKNDTQSKEEFAVFIEELLAAVPPPPPKVARSRFPLPFRHKNHAK